MCCFKCDKQLVIVDTHITEYNRSVITYLLLLLLLFFLSYMLFFVYLLFYLYFLFSSLIFHITLCHTELLCFPLVLISLASQPLLCRTDDVCRGWNELRVESITQRMRWVRRRDICLRGKEKVRKEAVGFNRLETGAHGNRWWKNTCRNEQGMCDNEDWKKGLLLIL